LILAQGDQQALNLAGIDGLHHTNNAVYVNWCQQAAWAHSVAIGLDLERDRALDRAMVIRHSEYVHREDW
jgi:acyl-CoA thioester hydrolase